MTKKLKAVYAGIILNEESQNLLKECVDLEGKTLCHHMTIAFKPTKELVAQLPMGKEVRLHVTIILNDGKAQAAGIDNNFSDMEGTAHLVTNKHPHITISCAEGISPVASNDLPWETSKHWAPIDHLHLTGRVGIFTGKSIQYNLDNTIYSE